MTIDGGHEKNRAHMSAVLSFIPPVDSFQAAAACVIWCTCSIWCTRSLYNTGMNDNDNSKDDNGNIETDGNSKDRARYVLIGAVSALVMVALSELSESVAPIGALLLLLIVQSIF